MTQQIINVGSGPSAGDGDPLRTAFIEINSNFTELYGTINGQAVTYSNVSGVTTSLGQGATFDVTKYVNSYSFVINRSGNGYSVGNTITIYGNLIGGAYSTQDVTVTVATLGNVTLGNIATFAFSGIPSQPVTSVAGRTGGVILTINDIVGLSAAYASQANIVTANTLTREYVDGQILAANAGVTAANLGMKGYVDQGNTIQTALITSQSAAIIAANLGMRGYVDSVASQSIYGNVNVKAYTESMGFQNFSNVNVAAYLTSQGVTGGSYSNVNATSLITSLGLSNYSNVNIKAYTETMGFQNFGNVNVAAYVTTANSAILGYIDLANTIQSGQVGAANLAIVAANLGMKGYVDSVASQSIYGNGNVTAYTVTMGFTNFSNVNVSALITTNGLTNFSNVNVKAYSETMGYQNYGNVNVAALITTNGLTNYSNVNVASYLAGNVTIGLGTTATTSIYGNLIISTSPYGYNPSGTIEVRGNIIQPTDTNPYYIQTGGNLMVGGDVTIGGRLSTAGQITVANVKLAPSGNIQFADGTVQTTAATGGGGNYGNANVTAYTESMGFTNFSNVNVSALITTNGLTNYSNVNAKAYAETMGYQNFGNVNVAAYVTTANSAVIGYVDNAVLTANVGMKGYVDAGVIWSISASGTADYVFSGPGIVAGNTNDPVLYLYKGLTYTFINTTGGSHPFAIRVSNGGADYTSGVSGSQTGTQTFTVPMDAPSTLYYQCTIHGGMGNTIYIGSIDNNYSNVNVKAYTESMGYQNYSNVNVAALITTNGLTNYSNVNVIAYLAGNITVGNIAGSVNGFAIGYRDVPQITVANLTLIASDAGKHYYGANTNPTTITIPTNANVAFGNGTAISIVNQGTGNITVANDAGVLLYLAGNTTAGSRTLTSYGMATLIKVQVNTWFINGTGVV
jgi:hypothetical protein